MLGGAVVSRHPAHVARRSVRVVVPHVAPAASPVLGRRLRSRSSGATLSARRGRQRPGRPRQPSVRVHPPAAVDIGRTRLPPAAPRLQPPLLFLLLLLRRSAAVLSSAWRHGRPAQGATRRLRPPPAATSRDAAAAATTVAAAAVVVAAADAVAAVLRFGMAVRSVRPRASLLVPRATASAAAATCSTHHATG